MLILLACITPEFFSSGLFVAEVEAHLLECNVQVIPLLLAGVDPNTFAHHAGNGLQQLAQHPVDLRACSVTRAHMEGEVRIQVEAEMCKEKEEAKLSTGKLVAAEMHEERDSDEVRRRVETMVLKQVEISLSGPEMRQEMEMRIKRNLPSTQPVYADL